MGPKSKYLLRLSYLFLGKKKTIGVLPGLLIGRYTLSVSCFPAHELEWRAFDKTFFWAVLAENKREDP